MYPASRNLRLGRFVGLTAVVALGLGLANLINGSAGFVLGLLVASIGGSTVVSLINRIEEKADRDAGGDRA